MKGSYRGPDRLEVKGTSLLMSIVLSIPFNSLSIPFVSLLKIFHFSLLYPVHTIVHHSGARAGDDLTERLVGGEVEDE